MEEGLSNRMLVKCRGLFNCQRGEFKHPGCIEHTSTVSHIIQEVNKQKGDLVVLWLDLTNAYGSVIHKVIEENLH